MLQFYLFQFESPGMIQDRGSNLESSQNYTKKGKNSRNVANSLSNSERLQNKMQLSSEKLQSHIKELNQKGLKAKEASDYAQALIYFQQCERLLEMGADCGKSIDRQLILIVLSNEAFAYHKLNKLQNAKKYLEATIFNIKQFLDDFNQLSLEQEIQKFAQGKRSIQDQTIFIKNQTQRINTLITRKKELVVAEMQYAELLAEGSHHQLAAQTGQKSLDSLIKYCSILRQYRVLTKTKNDAGCAFLQKLLDLPEQFKNQTLQSLSSAIKQILTKTNTFSYQGASQAEKKLFKCLKMEDFLLIKTKSFWDHQNPLSLFNIMDMQKLNSSHLMDLVILMVYVCLHFIIGAESLEFSRAKESIQKETLYILQEEGLQQKQSQFRSKKAQKHYLFSLMLILKYLPQESQLLVQLKEIYKSAFEQHYNALWSSNSQVEQWDQMQMMNIEFSANITSKMVHQQDREIAAQSDEKPKGMFTLKVPNTNDPFLDMPSIDSIQCISANSSMINISHNEGHPAEQSKTELQAESYFKNPNKSTKYNPLFMGTWDLRQFQKQNKSTKAEEKSENTQRTCQKTTEKDSKEIRHVQGIEQKQVFQIIIHKKQKQKSPMQQEEQIKQILEAQKLKIQKTEANSVNQQSQRNKHATKKKTVKNPELVKQKSKSKDNHVGFLKHQKKQLKIPSIKIKFNKAKSPPIDLQKKIKMGSKDTKLKKNTKSKSKNKQFGSQNKSKPKSLNKKNLSPSKNGKRSQPVYYQRK